MAIFRRKIGKWGVIYRLSACLIIVVIALYSQNSSINSINTAIKSAMIASGEMAEETVVLGNKNNNSAKGKLNMVALDKNLEDFLIRSGYAAQTKPGTKLVIYVYLAGYECPYHAQFQKDIAAYKNTPEWSNKYTFIERRHTMGGMPDMPAVTNEKQALQHNAFVDYCDTKSACIIDFQNKKMLSMPSDKMGDSKYLYEFLSAGYN